MFGNDVCGWGWVAGRVGCPENLLDPSRFDELMLAGEGSGRVSLSPVVMVWPCPLSVEKYVAAGRDVAVPRPLCSGCSSLMSFWSGYERSVRAEGRCYRLWVVRARCSPCRVTHALLPNFLLVGRLDEVDTVGRALGDVALKALSIGRVAGVLDVPFTTVRGWVRCFAARAPLWWSGFAALTVEFGGAIPNTWPTAVSAAADAAMGWAHQAASARH